MEIIEIETEEQLKKMLFSNPKKLHVIDCYAIWCGPCKVLGAKLSAFVKEHPDKLDNVQICKLDVENEDLAEFVSMNNIRSLPTVLFLKGDDVLETVVGNMFDKIVQTIQQAKISP